MFVLNGYVNGMWNKHTNMCTMLKNVPFLYFIGFRCTRFLNLLLKLETNVTIKCIPLVYVRFIVIVMNFETCH